MNGWYVSHCPSCDCEFALTNRMEKNRRADGASFYCPNGHSMSFSGENEAVRRERDRLKQEVARLEQEVESAKASAQRAHRRVAAGVCPCCNRTFQNVARHMKTQHPNVAPMRQKTD